MLLDSSHTAYGTLTRLLTGYTHTLFSLSRSLLSSLFSLSLSRCRRSLSLSLSFSFLVSLFLTTLRPRIQQALSLYVTFSHPPWSLPPPHYTLFAISFGI